MKVETDIITSLSLMYVKIFKTDGIVSIGNIMCIMADIFSIMVDSLILTMSLGEIKRKLSTLLIKYCKLKIQKKEGDI